MIDDTSEWEIEISYWVNHRGLDPAKARTFTTLRWMRLGDLRPLAAAILEDDEIDDAVFCCLARLIIENQIVVKASKGGRRRAPEAFARNIIAALEHERRGGGEKAFMEIADALAMSHQSVRQAVTRWRNRSAK